MLWGSRGRTAQRLPGWELGLETGPLENSSSTCPWLHWAGDSGGGGVRPKIVLSLISEGLPSPPHAELANSSSFFLKQVLLLVNGEKLAGVGQGPISLV